MADILDQADVAQDAFMREARARVPPPATYHGIGMCLNCSAALTGDARWCDADCRADWEQHGRK